MKVVEDRPPSQGCHSSFQFIDLPVDHLKQQYQSFEDLVHWAYKRLSRQCSFDPYKSFLRLLQPMTEGHKVMQDYLREQRGNLKSINTVANLIALLDTLSR